MDFEIKRHVENAVGRERYRLHRTLRHPRTGRSYEVYPDSLILLQGRGEFAEHKELFLLEVDRGTMDLARLRRKVIGYHLYRELGVFRQKAKALLGFTVLIQTTSPKRARNMRAAFEGVEGADLVWITDRGAVQAETVLSKAIWTDQAGRERSILLS